MRRLLVVDFANIAHRAYFAGRGRPSFAPDGRPVFLVGTFLRLVLARIREEQATHVALAFESTTGSRRREIDPGYKPRKAQEPDDLIPQLRDANIAAGRMGWARYRAEGWEADDAMASIADCAVAAAFDEVLLLTADHDLLGMASDRVAVLRPRAGGGVDRYGPSDVAERSPYRVPPGLVADVKALIGDATDGYGGVRGIGPSVGPDWYDGSGRWPRSTTGSRRSRPSACATGCSPVERMPSAASISPCCVATLHSRRPSTLTPVSWASTTASARHRGSRRWALPT